MAILGGGIPVVPSTPFANPYRDSRTIAFRSLDGMHLLPFTGSEFISLKGAQGLDLVPPNVVESSIPGMDGTRIADITIGSRKVFLPLWIGSQSSHAHYLQMRDELFDLFDSQTVDYRRTDGTFDLVASSVRGERTLRCQYLSGMDGDLTKDTSGSYWESIGLNLLAPRTHWSGGTWQTPVIRKTTGASWFGTFPGVLSSARALGADIPVTVDGNVPSPVTIDMVGPATSVLVTAPGLYVSIPAGLADGETAKIVTNPRGHTALFGGVKNWARVSPVYRRRPLAPGQQKITVALEGASIASQAVISGETLWRTPW